MAEYEEEQEATRPGAALDAHRAWLAVQRRWAIPASTLAFGLLLGAISFFLWPRTYTATAVLRYNGTPEGDSSTESAMGAALQTALLPSQLERVQRDLGLGGSTEDLVPFFEVEVVAPPLMNLAGRSSNPDDAARLANSLAASFVASRLELAETRNAEITARAAAEVSVAAANLEAIHGEQEAFRRDHGIADLPLERQRLIEEAAELRSRTVEAQIEADTESARATALQEAAAALPELVTTRRRRTSPELRAAVEELRRARATLTEDHPRVAALRAQVEDLRAALAQSPSETRTRRPSSSDTEAREEAEANANAAERRAASLEELSADVTERLREMTEIEGQASALGTRVRLAQEAHRNALATLSAHRDADTMADFAVEDPAPPPTNADPSKHPWVAAAAFPIIFLVVGLLIAIGADIGKLRVLTAKEVAWWGGGPVLGVTNWPADPRGLDALVAELEDLASGSIGRTLVVPATEDERDLACAFAARLAEAPWLSGGIVDIESEEIEATIISARSEEFNSDTVIMEALPPHLLAAIGAGEAPAQEAERISKATVRMFLPPEAIEAMIQGQSAAAEFENEFRSPTNHEDADRISFAGLDPVRVSRPETFVDYGATQIVPAPVAPTGVVNSRGAAPRNQGIGAVQNAAVALFEPRNYEARPSHDESASVALAWNGPLEGPVLRRAARLADRVVVLVRGGARSGPELRGIHARLGAIERLGFVVAAVPSRLMDVDRVGDVMGFWGGGKVERRAPVSRVATVKSQLPGPNQGPRRS